MIVRRIQKALLHLSQEVTRPVAAHVRREPEHDQTPATHAILPQLKAGETVYQADELPKHTSTLKYTTEWLKHLKTHV